MNVELTTDVNSNDFVDGNSSAIQIGYKHTELGPVPLGWSIVAFGQIVARTQLGGNYKNSESDTGLPLIKMGNLGRGFVKLHKQEFIIGEASESDLLSYGDVLFNTRNTLELVGKVAIWKNELPKAYFNSNLMRISFKDEFVSSNIFMNALMNTEKFIKSLSDIAIGTTSVAAIYNRDLFQIKLVLPTKEEQTAIANALSDVDALIQELEKLIVKKQAIKTAAMQQLLTGRTRLPQFAHHPDGRKKGYKPSELGEIPEDWELMPLGELTEVIRNGSNYKTIFKDGVPVTRIETIAKGFIDFDRTGIASEESIHPSYKLKDGDILYSHINSVDHIGKVAMFEGDRPLYHGINLLLIRVDHNTSSNWLYSYLSFFPSREWAKKIAKQAVSQASINTKELKQLVIPTPMFDEQEAIGLALKEFDHELDLCKLRLDKTHQIKQGMMQELLTGKTRLKS